MAETEYKVPKKWKNLGLQETDVWLSKYLDTNTATAGLPNLIAEHKEKISSMIASHYDKYFGAASKEGALKTPDVIKEEKKLFISKELIFHDIQQQLIDFQKKAEHTNEFYLRELSDKYIDKEIARFKSEFNTYAVEAYENLKTNPVERDRELEKLRKIQRTDLLANIKYLQENGDYDAAFKLMILKVSVQKEVSAQLPADFSEKFKNLDDPEVKEAKEAFLQNSNNYTLTSVNRGKLSVRSFDNLSPAVLPVVYESKRTGGILEEYARARAAQIERRKDLVPIGDQYKEYKYKQVPEGTWLKFRQVDINNHSHEQKKTIEDLYSLAAYSQNHPAQWCTGASVSYAENQLKEGDFFMLISKEANEPVLAIRYQGNEIAESPRGLDYGQAIRSSEIKAAEDFLNTETGGKKYLNEIRYKKLIYAWQENPGSFTSTDPDDLRNIKFAESYQSHDYRSDSQTYVRDQIKAAQHSDTSFINRLAAAEANFSYEKTAFKFSEISNEKPFYIGSITVNNPSDKDVSIYNKLTHISGNLNINHEKERQTLFVNLQQVNTAEFYNCQLSMHKLSLVENISITNSQIDLPMVNKVKRINCESSILSVQALESATSVDIRSESRFNANNLKQVIDDFVVVDSTVKVNSLDRLNYLNCENAVVQAQSLKNLTYAKAENTKLIMQPSEIEHLVIKGQSSVDTSRLNYVNVLDITDADFQLQHTNKIGELNLENGNFKSESIERIDSIRLVQSTAYLPNLQQVSINVFVENSSLDVNKLENCSHLKIRNNSTVRMDALKIADKIIEIDNCANPIKLPAFKRTELISLVNCNFQMNNSNLQIDNLEIINSSVKIDNLKHLQNLEVITTKSNVSTDYPLSLNSIETIEYISLTNSQCALSALKNSSTIKLITDSRLEIPAVEHSNAIIILDKSSLIANNLKIIGNKEKEGQSKTHVNIFVKNGSNLTAPQLENAYADITVINSHLKLPKVVEMDSLCLKEKSSIAAVCLKTVHNGLKVEGEEIYKLDIKNVPLIIVEKGANLTMNHIAISETIKIDSGKFNSLSLREVGNISIKNSDEISEIPHLRRIHQELKLDSTRELILNNLNSAKEIKVIDSYLTCNSIKEISDHLELRDGIFKSSSVRSLNSVSLEKNSFIVTPQLEQIDGRLKLTNMKDLNRCCMDKIHTIDCIKAVNTDMTDFNKILCPNLQLTDFQKMQPDFISAAAIERQHRPLNSSLNQQLPQQASYGRSR